MDLVRAERRAALADLGEVQASAVRREAADGEQRALRLALALDEHVIGDADGRAIEKAVDGVDVALARRAGPEMEPGLGLRTRCPRRSSRRGRLRRRTRKSANWIISALIRYCPWIGS